MSAEAESKMESLLLREVVELLIIHIKLFLNCLLHGSDGNRS